jgi:peptidoglycan hydrolase-like protein with peptidoglycan-binding domain
MVFGPASWSFRVGDPDRQQQAAQLQSGEAGTTAAITVAEPVDMPESADAAGSTHRPQDQLAGPPPDTTAAMSAPHPEREPVIRLDPGWLDRQHQMAWRSLAGLWQDGDGAGAIQSACDGVLRTGYACSREQGNWSRIRQLGLPVVLVLRDDQPRLLVLRGFAGDEVLVGNEDEALSVTHDVIEQRWLGEYFVVWPQAPDWPVEIRRGESGAAVDIVMEMAGLAEPAWNGSGVFDERFEAWLMDFQRRNGLMADGIIGPRTLMYLVAPTIVEPRLVVAATGGL